MLVKRFTKWRRKMVDDRWILQYVGWSIKKSEVYCWLKLKVRADGDQVPICLQYVWSFINILRKGHGSVYQIVTREILNWFINLCINLQHILRVLPKERSRMSIFKLFLIIRIAAARISYPQRIRYESWWLPWDF